jgi:hypothetical protein
VELVHLDGFITKKKPIYRVAQKMYTHCTLILMSKECIIFWATLYTTIIVLPLQQWVDERASMLCCSTFHVLFYVSRHYKCFRSKSNDDLELSLSEKKADHSCFETDPSKCRRNPLLNAARFCTLFCRLFEDAILSLIQI